MTNAGNLRIAVIGSVLAKFDAISNDVVRTARLLADTPNWKVCVLAGYNDREDIDAVITPRVTDLLIAREFLDADVIIYHFGIYYPLFDAILLGNGRAKQAVVFHNITPLQFVPDRSRRMIEMSFAQLDNLHDADAIWLDSRENQEMLLDNGFERDKLTIQPLAVDRPAICRFRKPQVETINVVFIGRIVRAKGILDLIEAMGILQRRGIKQVSLRVVGNIEAAESALWEKLNKRIGELCLERVVQFVGVLSDDDRDVLLKDSHVLAVPSYHEGFCVPVVEALRAGMVPVVYSAYNLKYIAGGLCVSTAPGDVSALATALQRTTDDVRSALAAPETAILRLDRGDMRVAEFEKAVAVHIKQFSTPNVASSLRKLVHALIGK